MRTIDYDKKDKNTGGTETHIATDEPIENKFGNLQHAYEEGFDASAGVLIERGRKKEPIEDPPLANDNEPVETSGQALENPGLADN